MEVCVPRLCNNREHTLQDTGPTHQSHSGPIPDDGLSWLNMAVKHWRVILLDQRGTGRSTPVRAKTLAAKGTVPEQVEYLKHFRADSIIKVLPCP